MSVTYEVRQQVRTVNGNRLEAMFASSFERPARMSYDALVRGHPGEYFELVKVTHDEDCLAFTRPAATQPASEGPPCAS